MTDMIHGSFQHILKGFERFLVKKNSIYIFFILIFILQRFFCLDSRKNCTKPRNLYYLVHCNPVQGQYRARTGKNLLSLQGTPVLIARTLYSLQGMSLQCMIQNRTIPGTVLSETQLSKDLLYIFSVCTWQHLH